MAWTAYGKGKKAFKEGLTVSDNPYVCHRDWLRWHDGWYAAELARCRDPDFIRKMRKP